jgi:hypothetical protein
VNRLLLTPWVETSQ